MSFKELRPFAVRAVEAQKILQRFPGRIPIIIERAKNSIDIPLIDKTKFLVPGHFSVGQFVYLIRKRMSLPPEKALFVFVGNTMPVSSELLQESFSKWRDNDGFLYMTYAGESTFGN
jgi:GABA(A) receptor-associated protein